MPHLRELVELYDGRPFAIVGVNSFDDEKTYRDGVKEFGVTWISAYQGADAAPISEMYRVQGYPTMLMIDHTGKIQYKGHGMDDDMLDRLVNDAEKASQR
jgi:predicted GNAT family acetyltransferase